MKSRFSWEGMNTARQSAKLHGNPISYAKIACKIRVGHVGCLNLRVESTYTMVLFLYHCARSLGRKIPIFFFILVQPACSHGLEFAFTPVLHAALVCIHCVMMRRLLAAMLGHCTRLHALCSLLCWAQSCYYTGKVPYFPKSACRASDCMGIFFPIPVL